MPEATQGLDGINCFDEIGLWIGLAVNVCNDSCVCKETMLAALLL